VGAGLAEAGGSSGVSERFPWAEADGAAHRKEEHEKRQCDRPDERNEDVPGRENDRKAHVDDLPDQPDEQARQRVAERDAEEPARKREGDALGGEKGQLADSELEPVVRDRRLDPVLRAERANRRRDRPSIAFDDLGAAVREHGTVDAGVRAPP
jgi:hypothetical protein